jgi:hypothetical protein
MNDEPFVFGEGKTEEVVFACLSQEKALRPLIPVNGKTNFVSGILEKVEQNFAPGIPGQMVRILAFRDRDKGEQIDSICQSFAPIGNSLRGEMLQFTPEQNFSNVLVSTIQPTQQRPGLRFVLHIADTPTGIPEQLNQFDSKTTDAYILSLALSDGVLSRFGQKVSTEEVRIGPDIIKAKVLSELPRLFASNGIGFDTDKDYLAAYLIATRFWKINRTEQEVRLVQVILDRAMKYATDVFEKTFASWMFAIEEAGR